MGELGGFLKIERVGVPYRDADERVQSSYQEFLVRRSDEELAAQGARCMECGVPFCHTGCPLGNLIPDWNDLVYRERWQDAIVQLHATNNFPEFTGRLCPAPCEAACVLEIREGDAVTIKQIENSIIDRAWEEGWVTPQPPERETGRRVAVVGAGPAGHGRRAAAAPRRPHASTLFERDEAAGGLCRFGVPDFKIEKQIVERRVEQLVDEGVELRCGVDVGVDVTAERAARGVRRGRAGDRLARAARPAGARPRARRRPLRDGLPVRAQPLGRDAGRHADRPQRARAARPHRRGQARRRDRRRRHRRGLRRQLAPRGRASITQLELLPEPPREPPRRPHAVAAVAAEVPPLLRDGGGQGRRQGRAGLLGRHDALLRRQDGHVTGLHYAQAAPAPPFAPVDGTEGELQADLVLLAMGFLHPEQEGSSPSSASRGPARQREGRRPTTTSVDGVFAAGDARRGQSLIVWAINEGRQGARMVERHLASPAGAR